MVYSSISKTLFVFQIKNTTDVKRNKVLFLLLFAFWKKATIFNLIQKLLLNVYASNNKVFSVVRNF